MLVSRKIAYLSLSLWILALALLSTQAAQLGGRLTYSEEVFLPRDSESYEGLLLLRQLGYAMGDTLLIIYSPWDLNTSTWVEESLREVLEDRGLRGYQLLGLYGVYKLILSRVEGNLSEVLIKALDSYRVLEEAGLKAKEAYVRVETVLNRTYGLASLYIKAYEEAVEEGLEDPAEYAYERLKPFVPVEQREVLEWFHRLFKVYVAEMKPGEAARRAIVDLSRAYDPGLAKIVEAFDLTNYTNPEAIARYVYSVSALKERNVSFDWFQRLLEDPRRGALDYVRLGLTTRVNECMGEAFERALAKSTVASSLQAEDVRGIVGDVCGGYIAGIAKYPDVIPEDVRESMLSQRYAIIYVYFNESISIDVAQELLDAMDEKLRGGVGELYYHGTLTLFADLGESTEREVRRIDVTTAALVIGLLVVLLGSIASPLIILVATAFSLVVAMGLLSLATLYLDVYYLARVVMIPVVFGVTVDYSVFYLFRVVEERSKGYSWGEAVYQAWRRAGRALTLGGIAVVLGFLAYVLTPQEALRGVGLALAIAAATSFLSSYTLLPAVLIVVGERWVFWPTRSLRLPAARQGVLLRRVAGVSLKVSPLVTVATLALAVGLALYLLSAPPSANIHLGLPPYSRFIEASEVLYTEFPKEVFSRAYIVTSLGDPERVLEELRSGGLIAGSIWVERGEGYTVLNVGLPLDPLDDGMFDLIPGVRGVVKSFDEKALVTGFTALRVDTVNSIILSYFKLTLPIALTLIIAYLIAGMGSVLVPLRLTITVAFSAVLSLAITTIAFSYLVEAPPYGSNIRSPIYWVTPIIVLGLMITLGMDYDVFLTSRIREEYERGGDQNKAILEAVEKTGVVITVCGLILAGAFSSLLLTEITLLKQVGLTVALSILVDTFIVRPLIVPAIMSLAGKYNWWPGKGLIRRWD